MTDEERSELRKELGIAYTHQSRLRRRSELAEDAAQEVEELRRTLNIAVMYVGKRILQISKELAEAQDFT